MPTSTKSRPADAGNPPAPPAELEDRAAPIIEDESVLVDAAKRGDLAAFGQIFQRYFNQVYDFAARVTRSDRVAAEITAETFTRTVDEIAGMGDTSRVRVAIYAIARSLAADRNTVISMADELVGTASEVDPEYGALVWEGARLLGPRTYAAVDLTARQGLTDSEVGAVTGIREDLAVETVVRTRERAEQAMAIFVLIKKRVSACPGLRSVVGAHASASLERDLADVVIGHIEQCEGCERAWGRIPSPLGVLRKLAVVTPAHGLRDRVWARVRRRYHWAGPGSGPRRNRLASAAALVALVLGVATAVSIGGDRVADAEVTASPNIEATRLAPPPVIPLAVTATTTPSTVTTTRAVPAAPPPSRPTSTTAVPSEPPVVGIITPVQGQQFASSSDLTFVELVAVVQDDLDDVLAVEWHDGPTYLGSGNVITAAVATGCPDAATHTITASATDSSGGTTSATVVFTVRCENPDG